MAGTRFAFQAKDFSFPSTPTDPSRPSLLNQQVKKFAQKVMKTSDVRVDVKLNKAIWSKGIRNVSRRARIPGHRPAFSTTPDLGFTHRVPVRTKKHRGADRDPDVPLPPTQVPRKLRVQISRKRNDDEDATVRTRSSPRDPRASVESVDARATVKPRNLFIDGGPTAIIPHPRRPSTLSR